VLSGLDLDELAAAVQAADRVIAADTGVAHLATALRRPSVVIFGPSSPAAWGPPARPEHQVLWHGRRGDAHGRAVDPGLLQVTVDEVETAIQ
jgi:ADP-heptose:LPS heptosyltransferase